MADELTRPSVLAPYFSRTRGAIRPGVHRMRVLLEACGMGVLRAKPRFLVTGTNGKGTTCAALESVLRTAGWKTGLYTSPHLVHPGERIRVNGIPSSEDVLAEAVARIDSAVSRALPDATFFEILTAAAFLVFEKNATEADVLEVGLGGRFDSTNVVSPTVSVLTSVGLDHTEFLGPTLRHIAFDKAHVSRRGRPLVCGTLQQDAWEGVDAAIARTGAFRVHAKKETLDARMQRVLARMAVEAPPARAQDTNLVLACHALVALENETGARFDDEDIVRGLANFVWPGRFDRRTVRGATVLFDAAHNAHGFAFFLEKFSLAFPGVRPVVVYASLADKDWQRTVPSLARFADTVFPTSPASPRAVPAEAIESALRACGGENGQGRVNGADAKVESALPLAAALDAALARARDNNLPCVVIGSIALLGDAMEILEVSPFNGP